MRYTVESLKDIKDLSNEELLKIINLLDLNDKKVHRKTCDILKEFITRKKKLIAFFEAKLAEEQQFSLLLLKTLWNGMDCKNIEMAKVFKEIEESISK